MMSIWKSKMLPLALLCAAANACAGDDGFAIGETGEELRASRAPRLIQPGAAQVVLAVTDDNFAIYQEGQAVYATKLVPGATRAFVAEVPAGNLAFPLQVGNVVFLWTDPQRSRPGFGVSPLVLWTSAGGPVVIARQASVGLVATAASPDGRQIIFPTNTSDDGLTGDLAYALTRKPLEQTILLENIEMNFPAGRCRPLAGFTGDRFLSFPVAAHCVGADTTATLSVWFFGHRRDLIANIATPLRFILQSDLDIDRFVLDLADGTLATVTLAGKIEIIDRTTSARAFIGKGGTVGYFTRPTATQGGDLRLAARGEPIQTIAPVVNLAVERFNRNGYFKTRFLSPDGRLAQYSTITNPATGLFDKVLLDVERGTSFVLDATAETVDAGEIFTADSRHALFLAVSRPGSGTGRLMSGNADGAHAVSETATVFDVFRATGSIVSYTENPFFDPARFFNASVANLMVADAADPSVPPRLVSIDADLFYLPSGDRERLVFTSQVESDGPGLYVASARP